MTEPTKLFVSYAREDEKWLEMLKAYFRPLEREKVIELWSDRDIEPGDQWDQEIEKAMRATKIGILLVSPLYKASDYIAQTEEPRLLEAHKKGDVRILILTVGHCRLSKNLDSFQAINSPERPLKAMSEAEVDVIFGKLVDSVEGYIRKLHAKPKAKQLGITQEHSQNKSPARAIKLSYENSSKKSLGKKDFEQEQISIGRSAKNDLCLTDDLKSVSGEHVKITSEGGKFYVTDSRSTNRTYINNDGTDITLALKYGSPTQINDGDQIKIGDFKVRVEIPEIPVKPAVAPASNEDLSDQTVLANPYKADVKDLVEVLRRIGEKYPGDESKQHFDALSGELRAAVKQDSYSAYSLIANILSPNSRSDS